jgi:hypothetical protein
MRLSSFFKVVNERFQRPIQGEAFIPVHAVRAVLNPYLIPVSLETDGPE